MRRRTTRRQNDTTVSRRRRRQWRWWFASAYLQAAGARRTPATAKRGGEEKGGASCGRKRRKVTLSQAPFNVPIFMMIDGLGCWEPTNAGFDRFDQISKTRKAFVATLYDFRIPPSPPNISHGRQKNQSARDPHLLSQSHRTGEGRRETRWRVK